MRELWRPILQSASAGTVNRLLALAIRFLTIPILVRYLGNERYGMWMTIASTTAYITLLDLGVVSALVNRLTANFRRGQVARANAYVVATSTLLTGVASLGATLVILLLAHVDVAHVFKLSSKAAVGEAHPTAIVTIVFAALQLACSPLLRVPYTMQRGYIAEAYSALGNILSLGGILAAVVMHLGVPYLAASLMMGPVVAGLGIAVHLCVKRQLRVQWIGMRRWRAAIRVLGHSASDYVVMQVSATLLSTLQFIMLASYKGAEAVTPYALLGQALMALQIPLAVLQQPLWTRLSALYDDGRTRDIRALFIQYLRVATAYSVFCALVIVFLSNPVLELVLKKQIVLDLGLRVGFAASCALGLIAGGNLGSLLFAVRLSRANAILSVAQLVVFVSSAMILTPRFSATGMVVSVVLSSAMALPLLARTLSTSLAPARQYESDPASFAAAS